MFTKWNNSNMIEAICPAKKKLLNLVEASGTFIPKLTKGLNST